MEEQESMSTPTVFFFNTALRALKPDTARARNAISTDDGGKVGQKNLSPPFRAERDLSTEPVSL